MILALYLDYKIPVGKSSNGLLLCLLLFFLELSILFQSFQTRTLSGFSHAFYWLSLSLSDDLSLTSRTPFLISIPKWAHTVWSCLSLSPSFWLLCFQPPSPWSLSCLCLVTHCAPPYGFNSEVPLLYFLQLSALSFLPSSAFILFF